MDIYRDLCSAVLVCSIVVNLHLFGMIKTHNMNRDFYSDLNLAYELATRDDIKKDSTIPIIAFGAIFFTLIPYLANLIIAGKVKKLIKNNETAKSWLSTSFILSLEYMVVLILMDIQVSGAYGCFLFIGSAYWWLLCLISTCVIKCIRFEIIKLWINTI